MNILEVWGLGEELIVVVVGGCGGSRLAAIALLSTHSVAFAICCLLHLRFTLGHLLFVLSPTIHLMDCCNGELHWKLMGWFHDGVIEEVVCVKRLLGAPPCLGV